MKVALFRTDDAGMPNLVPNTERDLSAQDLSECGDYLVIKFAAVDYPRLVSHIGKLIIDGDWDVFPLNRELSILPGEELSVSVYL